VCFVFIGLTYGRGAGVGRALGVGVVLGVGEGVAVTLGVGVGETVGVGVGLDCAQYLPPVLRTVKLKVSPPQTIISLPVQTAV
jgi:hypothetical protein